MFTTVWWDLVSATKQVASSRGQELVLLLQDLMLAGEVLELLPLGLDVRHGTLEQDRLGAALERGGERLAEALEPVTQLIAAALSSATLIASASILTCSLWMRAVLVSRGPSFGDVCSWGAWLPGRWSESLLSDLTFGFASRRSRETRGTAGAALGVWMGWWVGFGGWGWG